MYQEVWSQELQCYRTRNASKVKLKYTCFYLCSVRIVSSLIFRISTETVHSDGEKTNCKPCQTKTMLPFHSGSLWCVSLIGSLYFMVFKNRYTHSLIIPQYSVGCSTVKKAKFNGSFFKFFVAQYLGIVPILTRSRSLLSDLSFLEVNF